jgi:hypothetical protein
MLCLCVQTHLKATYKLQIGVENEVTLFRNANFSTVKAWDFHQYCMYTVFTVQAYQTSQCVVAFILASCAALSQEVLAVKWMSNQPALWTPNSSVQSFVLYLQGGLNNFWKDNTELACSFLVATELEPWQCIISMHGKLSCLLYYDLYCIMVLSHSGPRISH